jgi:hypothetical protein
MVVTSFLIVTLALFIFNLILCLLVLAQQSKDDEGISAYQSAILIIILILIIWNVSSLVSL